MKRLKWHKFEAAHSGEVLDFHDYDEGLVCLVARSDNSETHFVVGVFTHEQIEKYVLDPRYVPKPIEVKLLIFEGKKSRYLPVQSHRYSLGYSQRSEAIKELTLCCQGVDYTATVHSHQALIRVSEKIEAWMLS